MGNAQRAFIVYQSQLWDLTDAGYVNDVTDDGILAGLDRSFRPTITYRDGSVRYPWIERGGVSTISSSGYFAGNSCCGIGFNVLYHGDASGGLRRIPLDVSAVFATRINRAGHAVGRITTHDFVGSYAFLYRDQNVFDVNRLVDFPGAHFKSAVGITDTDVIAVDGGLPNSIGSSKSFLLIPTAPQPPARVRFTIAGRTVTLSWDAAPGATEYLLEAGSAPGRADLYNASVGSVLAISGTVPPGTYFVRLRARNVAGPSTPSQEVVIVVPETWLVRTMCFARAFMTREEALARNCERHELPVVLGSNAAVRLGQHHEDFER